MNKLYKFIALFIVIANINFVQARKMPSPKVHVVAANIKSLSPVAWVPGTIESRNNSKLAAEISGRLMTLAEIGSLVKKGDIVAQIDTSSLQIEKQENLANVQSAMARLEFLESEVSRKTSLSKRNLSAKTDLDETISQREIAKGNLAIAKAQLNQIEQKLSFGQLKAPFDGLISERLSNQGEFVNSGVPIVRIVETGHLEASVFVPLTTHQYIKNSTMLAISSPLGEGNAPVKAIVPVASERSHLMQVRLDMSSFDWPIGLALKVAIANGESKEVMAVPRDALILRREGTSIFRVNPENKAEQIQVKVGIGSGELIQVIGDINEGDQIIIRGAENLKPGQTVEINESNNNLIFGKR